MIIDIYTPNGLMMQLKSRSAPSNPGIKIR
jgi:hypothetical protein